MKTVIHVHQQKIRQGKPAIIVKTYLGVRHTRRARIGKKTVILQPEKQNSCGARVWIETTEVVR